VNNKYNIMAQKQGRKKKVRRGTTRLINRKQLFLAALEQSGGHIKNACTATKIHRSTIYDWMEKDKKFELALELVRDDKIDNVEAALYKNALEGDTVAQIFFLKTIGKKRGYVEKQEIVNIMEVDFTEG
jgi:hypothetical protein